MSWYVGDAAREAEAVVDKTMRCENIFVLPHGNIVNAVPRVRSREIYGHLFKLLYAPSDPKCWEIQRSASSKTVGSTWRWTFGALRWALIIDDAPIVARIRGQLRESGVSLVKTYISA